MVKGGYQIINFNGVELKKGTPKQISNIYDKIEGTDKSILLSGLNVNGVDYRDIFCESIVVGDGYVIKAFGFKISISDIDKVTVEDDIITDEILDLTFFGSNPTNVQLDRDEYYRLTKCSDGASIIVKLIKNDTTYSCKFISADDDHGDLYFACGSSIIIINLAGNNTININ